MDQEQQNIIFNRLQSPDNLESMNQVNNQNVTNLETQLNLLISENEDLKKTLELERITLNEKVDNLINDNNGLLKTLKNLEQDLDKKIEMIESYQSKTNSLLDRINQLNNSIEWYKTTFEKRKILGIIKDRLFKIINPISNFPSLPKIKQSLSSNNKFLVKSAKTKGYITDKVLCSVVNYNLNENASRLRSSFSNFFDTIVFDSGSDIKDESFFLLENVYYSGLLNESYSFAKKHGYEYLLFICSDVQIKDDQVELMFKNLNEIDLSNIGVYSPSSQGRSHVFCKKVFEKGLRTVPFVEGFIFMARLDVLESIAPVDLSVNKYGWGLDIAKGYFSRKRGLLCVIDDGVSVYHPDGTGYSDEFAEVGMWNYLDSFNDLNFKNFYSKHIDIIRRGLASQNKISVIVPCYNQASYIYETILNILQQEYSNIEIVIVNDGSTDNSEEIILPLVNNFPQIKYITKPNKGLGNTRNVGIGHSSGGYIQFLDSDDILSGNKFLNQIYDFILNEEVEVSYSEYLCFNDGDKEKTWKYSRLILQEDSLLDLIRNWETELSIPVHCFLFKKTILNQIWFDEELPNHEDWDFHLKIASKKPKYIYQPDAIAFYRVRNTSMSRDRNLMILGKKMCIEKAINSGAFKENYLNELNLRLNEE